MAIQLTPDQVTTIQNLLNQGNYPAAYTNLAEIVRNTPGADQRLANWFDAASHINANDGSYISDYVRVATVVAAAAEGQTLTAEQFQNASNLLADTVIGGIANGD